MTITLASINDVPAAVRGGGVVECPGCEGSGQLTTVNIPWSVTCRKCGGTGAIRYHYIGWPGSDTRLKYTPLVWLKSIDAEIPCPVCGGTHWRDIGQYEHDTCPKCGSLGGNTLPWQDFPEVYAALDAIGPNDILIHDGTDIGARCAEVVAAIARQRKEPTNA